MVKTIDPSLLQEYKQTQAELAQLHGALEERRSTNPLSFFVPNGKQEERIQPAGMVNLFSAANGVGKTALMANIMGNACLGHQSDWFKRWKLHERLTPPIRGRIVSNSNNIMANIVPQLHEWLPPTRYQASKASRDFDSVFRFDNGSFFDIMTYDQDAKQFEGPTIQLILFDEPPPKGIFDACVSRLRMGGFIYTFMTPLDDAGWMFSRANNPWKNQKPWSIVTAHVEDNCKQHGVRGILDHSDIEEMISEYDPLQRQARIEGKPTHLSGVVYPTFDPDVHIIDPADVPEDGPVWCIVDPHDARPFAFIWARMTADHRLYIFDEWPHDPFHDMTSNPYSIEDYERIIAEEESVFSMIVLRRIIDARYGNRPHTQTEIHQADTIRDMFDKVGLHFDNSYTDDRANVHSGHQAVRELLKPSPVDGRPYLYVSSECRNTIHGFLNYRQAPNRPNSELDPKDKPLQLFKDFMDLVRYLVKDNPYYVTPEELREVLDLQSAASAHVPDTWPQDRGFAGTETSEALDEIA